MVDNILSWLKQDRWRRTGRAEITRGWGSKASFGRTVCGNFSLIGLARKTLPPANSAWWATSYREGSSKSKMALILRAACYASITEERGWFRYKTPLNSTSFSVPQKIYLKPQFIPIQPCLVVHSEMMACIPPNVFRYKAGKCTVFILRPKY